MPAEDRPPVNIVRYAFQTMAGIGTFLALLGALFVWTWYRKRRLPASPWFFRAVMAAGPLSFVALIAGWITTEVGRQPWIVYEVMRTEQAVTQADGLEVGYIVLVAVYIGLGIAVGVAAAPARAQATGDGGDAVAEICAGVHRARDRGLRGPGQRRLRRRLLGSDRRRRGAAAGALRGMIQRSMAPVWEANHVWLIFVLVIVWTAFPVAFGSIFSTLHIPLFLAAIGIIFRGTAFALRGQAATINEARVLGALFATASVLIPFCFGAVLGGIASGRVGIGNATGRPDRLLAEPDVGADRRDRRADRRVPGRGLPRGRLGARRAARPGARLPVARAAAPAPRAGSSRIGGLLVLRSDARSLYDGLTSGGGLAMVLVSAARGRSDPAARLDRALRARPGELRARRRRDRRRLGAGPEPVPAAAGPDPRPGGRRRRDAAGDGRSSSPSAC